MRVRLLLPLLASLWLLPAPAAFAQASPGAMAGAPPTPSLLAYAGGSPQQKEAPENADVTRLPFFVGFTGGVSFATLKHPQLNPPSFTGPFLAVHAGYTLNPHLAVALEFSSVGSSVSRQSAGAPFSAVGSRVHPLAECTTCKNAGPIDGGYVVATTLLVSSLGPRVDYTPFGQDGLFVGAGMGVALLSGVDGRAGFAATARAGYRARFGALTLSAEGGIQGHAYEDGSAALPYLSLAVRPYF